MQRRGGHNLDSPAQAFGGTAKPQGSIALALRDGYGRQRLEEVGDRPGASLEALNLQTLAKVGFRLVEPVLPHGDVAEHQKRHSYSLEVAETSRDIQACLEMCGRALRVRRIQRDQPKPPLAVRLNLAVPMPLRYLQRRIQVVGGGGKVFALHGD